MTLPRYQVFVSSTFRDLQDERQSVLDAILEMNHIPAGMEIFPAVNATPWELIQRIIRESDYYILIVGGKYGSADENGISYTEREYDYAHQLNKPTLAFLHEDPNAIPFGKSEPEDAARNKLVAFRKKVERYHCKYWRNKEALKSQVIISLNWAISTTPVAGWVRADGIDNTELLGRLADLQQRYDLIVEENQKLRKTAEDALATEHLSQGEEAVTVKFSFWITKEPQHVELTWNQIFYGFGDKLISPSSDHILREALSPVVFGSFYATPAFNALRVHIHDSSRNECKITDKSLDMIMYQFLALGLVENTSISGVRGDKNSTWTQVSRAWKFSPRGLKLFLTKRALPKQDRSANTEGS